MLFHALLVRTVAGVDHNLVTDVAEKGNTHLGTCLYCSGLECVGGGVALDTGLGIGDFEGDGGGHLASEDGVRLSVYHGLADVTVLEELYAFNALAGDDYLFPGLGVEEVVAHIVLVGVLVGATLDANLVNLHAGVPCLVEHTAGLDVLEFGTHESRTFAGLYMEEFNDEEVLAVDVEAHSVFKVCSCCHKVIYIDIFDC